MPLFELTLTTAVAAASAAATVGTFFAYLYFARRSEAHAARDEALALARTRGEVIRDLRRRVASLEHQLAETTAEYERRVHELEDVAARARAEAREDAYQMQRFYAASLADLLRDVQIDLERTPPNLERPLGRIRQLLAGHGTPA